MLVLEHPDWTVRSTKLWFTSRNRWDIPLVTDLVWPLIFSHMNSGVKYKVTPAPLGLNCIYCRSNTKAWSSMRLPAEAMARRKTVFKVKCLREASLKGS